MVTESSSIWIRTASFLPPRDCDAEMLPSTPDGVLSEWIIRVPESVPMPELSSPLPPPPPPRADGPIESSDISLCDVFVGLGRLKRFGTNTWLVLFFDRLGWSQLMMIFGLFFLLHDSRTLTIAHQIKQSTPRASQLSEITKNR